MLSWFRGRKARTRRTHLPRRKALGMEGLEDRRLLAGLVNVTQSGGTLLLIGDAASNAVSIQATGVPGQFAVVGDVNVSGAANPGVSAPTLLRGTGAITPVATLTFNNVTNIVATLGAGDDQIGISTVAGNAFYDALIATDFATNNVVVPPAGAVAGSAAILAGSITITTGTGNDAVVVLANVGGAITVDTGADSDYVAVESSTAVSVSINTGAGDTNLTGADRVRVRDTAVVGAIAVNTYAGSDIVDVFGSTAQAIVVNSGDNGAGSPFVGVNPLVPEAVRLIGVTATSVSINTNGGNDQVIVAAGVAPYSTAATNIQTLSINTDAGNDLVEIALVGAAAVQVQNLAITTGVGIDNVSIGNAGVGTTVGLNTTIDLGPGNDVLNLTNFLVGFFLYVNLGDGNDTVTATGTFATYSLILGGPGFDTFTPVASGPLVFVQ
jgi:hypothetical protein